MIKVLRVDASNFNKNVGDVVKKGEVIGYLKNLPVVSDINGIIDCIYFDEDNHELEIVILSRNGENNEGKF
ncbi:hypothetical protein ACPB8Q_06290 [Methanocaldococcus indicus]|uniref:hypothetical protein n=1 Tax=Methanocaldococcus indicus TaxID=213231 RepID=UPI003C6CCE55